MTSPSGGTPGGGVSGSGGMAAHAATTEPQWKNSIYDQVNWKFGGISLFGGLLTIFTAGFSNVLEAIFGTVDNDYVADMAIINEHTNSITTLQAAFNQMILQGNALVFTSNNTYTPSAGIVSVDLILVGAGGGGGSGRRNVGSTVQCGGGGGGGGGEVHLTVPAALLPKGGSGAFLPIAITIGGGGQGAQTEANPGVGGGNTIFGDLLTAYGGQGGMGGDVYTELTSGRGGTGGVGIIRGGNGGSIEITTSENVFRGATSGGNSFSGTDLYGGGGGGGAGASSPSAAAPEPTPGGAGGISPGGAAPGGHGTAPSAIVATGGGGGAGSVRSSSVQYGGNGALAGGGGGGAGAALTGEWGRGGNGGNGILYVIERMV